jgi:predicted esterase
VISVEFGRRAAELLTEAGLAVDYVESEAGHWLPPEVLPRARDLVSSRLEEASNLS